MGRKYIRKGNTYKKKTIQGRNYKKESIYRSDYIEKELYRKIITLGNNDIREKTI